MPRFANLTEQPDGIQSAEMQAALLARTMDRSLTWESLDWLRRHWDGPLLVKGILSPECAREAVGHGVDGIVVSNHGGRQLSAAPATLDVLSSVVGEVGGRIPVFVDSGFRRGTDVVKALALGARAVLTSVAPYFTDSPAPAKRV